MFTPTFKFTHSLRIQGFKVFISKATIHVYNRSSVMLQWSVDQEWLILGMGTPGPQ